MVGRTALTNKLVSKQLGIEEKRVESVVNFVFKELQDEMIKMEEPFIYVRGLGTFGIYLKGIEKRIITLRRVIREQEELERRGVVYNRRASMLAGMRTEIFKLFAVRRMIKKRKDVNKSIKDGKTVDDCKG